MKKYIFDLESNGLLDTVSQVWCIVLKDLSNNELLTFSDLTSDETARPLIEGIKLIAEADVIICHNVILYDMLVLAKLYPSFDFSHIKLVDTLILSQLFNFGRPLKYTFLQHGLEAWGKHFKRYKPEQNQWLEFEEAMLHRCREDVEINYLVYRYLQKESKEIGIDKEIIAREMTTAIVSQQQVVNGWRLDTDLARQHCDFLDVKIEELRAEIEPNLPKTVIKKSVGATWEEVNKVLGNPFKRVPVTYKDERGRDVKLARRPTPFKCTKAGCYLATTAKYYGIAPNSIKNKASRLIDGPFTKVQFEDSTMSQHAQVKLFLFSQGWQPTEWNYKKAPGGGFLRDGIGGKIRTTPKLTEDSYDSIKGELGKKIATYNTYSNRRKVIENPTDETKGWLNNLVLGNRIICTPRTVGAATARMTHSGLVNVPGNKAVFGHEMRELFIATEGYEIVACDMAAAQVRLLAVAMGDPAYMKTVLKGSEEDEQGNYIGTDIHSVNGIAAGLINKDWEPGGKQWKDGRAKAKTFIYAFLFGAGDLKLGTIVNGGAPEGKKLREQFLVTVPSLGRLISKLEIEWKQNKKAKADAWFTGLDGRRIYCNSPHKILNYKLQSDEAILLKQWMCNVDEAIKKDSSLTDYKFLLSYHDELNYEAVPSQAHALGKILKQGIQDAGKLFGITIMDGDYKIGESWAAVH